MSCVVCSRGTKELFNLVLKARHLCGSDSAFCTGFSRFEETLDGIPLGLGLVMGINLLNFMCLSTF